MDNSILSNDWEKINLNYKDINPLDITNFVNAEFDKQFEPSLEEFIKIPNLSPAYDPDWKTNNFLKDAANHLKNFAENIGIVGLKTGLFGDQDTTPLLFVTIDPTVKLDPKSVLMYGHMDKQPPFTGWDDDKSPTKPVIQNGRLYGRGSSDDGYALYAALLSIKTLQNLGIPHPKIKIIIEGDEESGSTDLPIYLEKLKDLIGTPDLIVCMDSGIGDYNRLWLTNTLRGICNFDLTIRTVTKGIHSGKGSGIAPETFMILRALLSRIEDSSNGILKKFETDIPEYYLNSAKVAGVLIGKPNIPLLDGVKYMDDDVTNLLLKNFWKPSLAIVGAEGIPAMPVAGNVLRPFTTVRISIRTPPNFDCNVGGQIIEDSFNKDIPFNAKIEINNKVLANGVLCPLPSDKLKSTLSKVSKAFFADNDYAEVGVGGSIPFINILATSFPNSLFVITGCVNNDSNIHGPNENLNLDYCKKFISSLAYLIGDYKSYVN